MKINRVNLALDVNPPLPTVKWNIYLKVYTTILLKLHHFIKLIEVVTLFLNYAMMSTNATNNNHAMTRESFPLKLKVNQCSWPLKVERPTHNTHNYKTNLTYDSSSPLAMYLLQHFNNHVHNFLINKNELWIITLHSWLLARF